MEFNFSCRLNNTSYGLVGLNLLKSSVKAGNEVTYWPIEDPDRISVPPEDVELVLACMDKQRRYNSYSPSVRLCHQNDLARHIGKGIHVGMTIFELDRFTVDEFYHLMSQDGIITTSKWGKKVLEDNGIKAKFGVVPCGVDREIFNENVTYNPIFIKDLLSPNPTVFCNVSKQEVRKGHAELIEAFNKAFSPKDNVLLILAWQNRFYTKEENDKWDDLAKNSPMGERIFILPKFLDSQKEIAEIYAASDCGVFPSKAEGFGLGPLEMMSHGKQVILTNYSGHTEFATNTNSLLIEPTTMEEAYDGKWFFGQGQWMSFADEQMKQLIEHMRNVHKEKQENGKMVINTEGVETAKKFSWENSASKLTNFLDLW